MTEDTQKMIDAMHTKTPSTKTKIRHLSGGNQQKVILGRWLLLNPDAFSLDDPTRVSTSVPSTKFISSSLTLPSRTRRYHLLLRNAGAAGHL